MTIMKRYSISENVLNKVMSYLGTCRYDQVTELINEMRQDAKEIVENTQTNTLKKKE